MPNRAPRRCGQVGCRQLIRNPGQYLCPVHERERQRSTNARRSKSNDYSGAWRKISEEYLRRHPLCEECLKHGLTTPSQHTDHIVPLREGGTNQPSNLQAVCISCHSRKTSKFDGGYGNQKKSPQERTSRA